MPVFPIPFPPNPIPAAHFSAAEFFRDSPWLNVPSHRKADILVEPLYPRMGLLGGAQEGGGKVSKLAALAAARKKKEGEKTPSETSTPAAATTPSADDNAPGTPATKGGLLSLRERLAGNGKSQKSSEGVSTLRSLGKGSPAPSPLQKKPSTEPSKSPAPAPAELEPKGAVEAENQKKQEPVDVQEKEEQPEVNIRAPPSSFASTIVGDSTRPKMTEPSHLYSNTVDLMKIYGQDHTKSFDFAGPSPDDVVANAQSSAKGLDFQTKM